MNPPAPPDRRDPPAPPAPPTPHGDRLALIVGHTLPAAAFTEAARRVEVEVPAGPDGAADRFVTLLDVGPALVLFRHGLPDERFTPAHRVDHHAHVRALCEAGADRVVALASVGSLRTDWPVGTIVAPDDFLAPHVAPTFHADAGGHTVPGFDAEFRRNLVSTWHAHASAAATATNTSPLRDGGTYAQTSGPRFETPAEVRMLAHFADVVGMTLVGEAVLAAEAGLRYAAIAVVDNLANGLDTAALALDDYRANKAANEAAVAAALRPTLEALAGAPGGAPADAPR